MISLSVFRRFPAVAAVVVLLLGVVAPSMLLTAKAHAFPTGGQLEPRAIEMSDDKAGATGVNYNVQFKPASNYTVKGIVVDFCDGSSTPIVGDSTCTATGISGFTVGAVPGVSVTPGQTATGAPQSYTYTDLGTGGGTWNTSSINSGRTFEMTNTTGVSLSSSNVYDFTITGVTNPSTYVGTYYARIVTYTASGGDITTYAPGAEGSSDAKDYGGIALSTTNSISITAKIQEKLQFCVSQTDFTNINCAGSSVPSLILGHGVPVATLDNTQTNTANAFTQVSTNATNGFIIRMRNSNTCGGLSKDGGTTCGIAPAGATAVAIPAGTAALFGMLASGNLSETWTNTGTVTPTAPYDGTTTYGMDNTTAGSSVGATPGYGSNIMTATGPVNSVDNQLTFAATATNTTPAGLYVATMTLIATGYF